MDELSCQKVIGKACFKAFPAFARRAIAYRLLHLLVPPDIAKLLPTKLSDPLIAPGVKIPLDAKFPPGTCIVPGCSFPAGWDPDQDPPECSKSAPLPTLAMIAGGGNPSVFLSPGEPGTGQVKPPPAPPPSELGSGTYYPAASSDDGYFYAGPVFHSGYNDMLIGDSAAYAYHCWTTFSALQVPQGATITSAILTLHNAWESEVPDLTIKIRANDVDAPTNPTNYDEANGLVLTTAYVDWKTPQWLEDTYPTTDDLSTIIQEIVNRPGWAIGNNLMIVIHGNIGTYNTRWPSTFDQGNPDNYPALAIAWE